MIQKLFNYEADPLCLPNNPNIKYTIKNPPPLSIGDISFVNDYLPFSTPATVVVKFN